LLSKVKVEFRPSNRSSVSRRLSTRSMAGPTKRFCCSGRISISRPPNSRSSVWIPPSRVRSA